MNVSKHALRYHFEYYALLCFKNLIRLSPFILLRTFARFLRILVKTFDKKHLHQVIKNLELAYPDWTVKERNRLLEDVYDHFSMISVDWLYLFAHHKRDPRSLPLKIVNGHHLEEVIKFNRGAIIVSAHLGNWEMIPYILKSHLSLPLISVARQMNNQLVEKLVLKFRQFMGSDIIYKQGSLRKILSYLKAKRFIYLLIDQNTVPREAVFVDFFGHRVSAVSSAAQLHLKKEIPLLPMFLHYEPHQIVLEIGDPILPPSHEYTIESLTQHLTTTIEHEIRKHPEQWLWFHNRWKTRAKECHHEH